MLSNYLICPTCESLFSPEFNACPICGAAIDTDAEHRVFRILPHVVCGNCGNLVPESADICPFCEAPMDSHAKREIVEQPVGLEIVGVTGTATVAS
ncbi:MAG: zinc ribbon domain-containing protein [Bacteroidales bacterium]|nr:zinc ribbon domain-containing protein [Bacteroidales bacterium]